MNREIWQVGTVTEVSPGQVRIAFDRLSTCDRCLNGEGCGAGVFARLFSRRQALITLDADTEFRVGQKLKVGIPAWYLLSGALVLYGLPLLAFITGIVLAGWLVGDGPLADLTGLIAGLILAGSVLMIMRRARFSRLNPKLQPLSCNSSGCAA